MSPTVDAEDYLSLFALIYFLTHSSLGQISTLAVRARTESITDPRALFTIL